MRDRILWGAVGAGFLVIVALAAGALFVGSGTYDIAASSEHTGPVRWILSTVQERAVRARADRIPASSLEGGAGARTEEGDPGDPDGGAPATGADDPTAVDSATLRHGFVHFDAMCVVCHGAPGVEPGEIGRGLNPEAPPLEDEAEEWSDPELFWIVKNGLKMTGMPAFGPTHGDEEIRGIVSFVRLLPEMSEEEYARLSERWRAEAEAHDARDHTHDEETAPHEH